MTRKGQWVRLIAITLCGLIFLLPIWWMAVSASRPPGEAFRFLSLSIWTFLPNNPTLANIVAILQDSFSLAIFNTAIVALATVALGLAVCSAAAFALAAIDFPGRGAIFAVIVVSFLVPFDSIVVPLAQIMRGANLQNTYLSLILPAIGNGMVVFLLRQFFLGIQGSCVKPR